MGASLRILKKGVGMIPLVLQKDKPGDNMVSHQEEWRGRGASWEAIYNAQV